MSAKPASEGRNIEMFASTYDRESADLSRTVNRVKNRDEIGKTEYARFCSR